MSFRSFHTEIAFSGAGLPSGGVRLPVHTLTVRAEPWSGAGETSVELFDGRMHPRVDGYRLVVEIEWPELSALHGMKLSQVVQELAAVGGEVNVDPAGTLGRSALVTARNSNFGASIVSDGHNLPGGDSFVIEGTAEFEPSDHSENESRWGVFLNSEDGSNYTDYGNRGGGPFAIEVPAVSDGPYRVALVVRWGGELLLQNLRTDPPGMFEWAIPTANTQFDFTFMNIESAHQAVFDGMVRGRPASITLTSRSLIDTPPSWILS